MSALAPTLQAFFTDRLMRQRQASSHTLSSYRDTMKLLVRFAAERRKVYPVGLEISDLDSALISAFLDHRERGCGNSIRTTPGLRRFGHCFVMRPFVIRSMPR
jgi:integrase/recombinase XerD